MRSRLFDRLGLCGRGSVFETTFAFAGVIITFFVKREHVVAFNAPMLRPVAEFALPALIIARYAFSAPKISIATLTAHGWQWEDLTTTINYG